MPYPDYEELIAALNEQGVKYQVSQSSVEPQTSE